jgi:acetyltransferase-like isoleucine patch superfamily enzyme
MNKLLLILCSIPRILFFNFRYFPLYQAFRLPIFITYNTKVVVKGKIRIDGISHFGMIRIGFHKVNECNSYDQTILVVEKGAVLEFKGYSHLGRGSKLYVVEKAKLVLGDNFSISASSAISCYHYIEFGKDIQFSWNCLVMDSDTHVIYDINGKRINEDKPIIFEDKIWIGCNCTILKGTIIPSNCVIGANSVVTGNCFLKNSIIAGNPAKTIKEIGGWRL